MKFGGKSKFNELDNLSNDIPNLNQEIYLRDILELILVLVKIYCLEYQLFISESQATFHYASDNEIQFRSNLIGLHPYFGWNLSEHELDIQVAAGFGSGEMEIVQAKYESELLDSHFNNIRGVRNERG